MSSPMSRTLVAGLTTALALTVVTLPGVASEPESSTVSDAAGERTATWTGEIPPGAGEGIDCNDSPSADTHTVELTIEGDAPVRLRFDLDYEGDTDQKIAVVLPDGEVATADDGFVDSSESLTVGDAEAGTYEFFACPYAAAEVQAYDGSVTAEPESDDEQLLIEGRACKSPAEPGFDMGYIDTSRAGGEPIMTLHPDGQLLWGSHAGTTHFYTPAAGDEDTAAFVENYEGQTYQYVSEDGEGWDFVPRQPVPDSDVESIGGQPASGFSDPEFAIDAAGNVFISEINLANIAVSKSTDGGHSYALQNTFAFTQTDRQWMAADGEDELYMTGNGFGGGPFFPGTPAGNLGHFMAKSTDGGVTWSEASTTNPGGVADIEVDRDRGLLYELTEEGGTLSMARFDNIRNEETDFSVERFTIAEDLGLTGVQRLIDPTFAMDEDGNLYAVWTDNGTEKRPQGIYYSYSTDQGESWALPHRVDGDDHADVWPWIDVGDPGEISIVWLEADQAVEGELPGEEGGDDIEWNVMSATSMSALGCGGSERAGLTRVQASSEPVHTGTICQHGTTCQTDLTDRRLGDYFANLVDADGRIHIAVSDTRQGGAVALPLHIRQTSGPLLTDEGPGPPDDPGGKGRAPDGGGAQAAPDDSGGPDGGDGARAAPEATGQPLAATGGGALALFGVLLLAVAGSLRRR